MLPFLALHSIAAPRGEGLRPEFLEMFRRIAGNPASEFPSGEKGQAVSVLSCSSPVPNSTGSDTVKHVRPLKD
jgi:hypothetical protein